MQQSDQNQNMHESQTVNQLCNELQWLQLRSQTEVAQQNIANPNPNQQTNQNQNQQQQDLQQVFKPSYARSVFIPKTTHKANTNTHTTRLAESYQIISFNDEVDPQAPMVCMNKTGEQMLAEIGVESMSSTIFGVKNKNRLEQTEEEEQGEGQGCEEKIKINFGNMGKGDNQWDAQSIFCPKRKTGPIDQSLRRVRVLRWGSGDNHNAQSPKLIN